VKPIEVGSQAPAIALPDQEKNPIDLSTIEGTKLLSFHPLAWTGVCQRQMEGLELFFDDLAALGTTAFGISVDPVPSKKAWADAIGVVKTRLLSDFWPHGAVAESLGIFRASDGISERASVIVDATGVVRYVEVHPIGEVPDLKVLLEELKKL